MELLNNKRAFIAALVMTITLGATGCGSSDDTVEPPRSILDSIDLGSDAANDCLLKYSEAYGWYEPEDVLHFYCNGVDVTAVNNLSKLVSLKTLQIIDSSIQSLDLTNLSRLEELFLSRNSSLETIRFSGNENLQQIYLSNSYRESKLKELTIADMPELREIEVRSDDSLASFHGSNLPALKSLLIRSQSLSQFSLSQAEQLYALILNNNQLSELTLNEFLNLKHLRIGQSLIQHIDLSANTAVQYVTIENSPITEIDLSNNVELTNLYLRNNQLKQIRFTNNSALKKALLEGNDFDADTLSYLGNIDWIAELSY
ncbi:hypothetical protein [Paraferrimonas haliotis]|uniref:Leucine-rich repeat domain-containing protein n=1 Tax=Paraferrimonas haliotis TaxID=2013866 RepID=A0AA37TV13_9GAMM|nr:hypothetical protein [Paraferrimonas haliotis]GLS83424.1 hypothetical protein GCM10007894_14010 [Paraferrimonas haliotis]